VRCSQPVHLQLVGAKLLAEDGAGVQVRVGNTQAAGTGAGGWCMLLLAPFLAGLHQLLTTHTPWYVTVPS
jgi:hypothetical protein